MVNRPCLVHARHFPEEKPKQKAYRAFLRRSTNQLLAVFLAYVNTRTEQLSVLFGFQSERSQTYQTALRRIALLPPNPAQHLLASTRPAGRLPDWLSCLHLQYDAFWTKQAFATH